MIEPTWRKASFQQIEFSGKTEKSLRRYPDTPSSLLRSPATRYWTSSMHTTGWLFRQNAAKEISGKPLVVHVHVLNTTDLVNLSINRCMKSNGLVCSCRPYGSESLTKYYCKKYGYPGKVTCSTTQYWTQVSSNLTTRKSPRKIVTFLGRITFQKGPEYFVKQPKKYRPRSNVRFVMAGSGDLLNR